jgi:hypothetical protein
VAFFPRSPSGREVSSLMTSFDRGTDIDFPERIFHVEVFGEA